MNATMKGVCAGLVAAVVLASLASLFPVRDASSAAPSDPGYTDIGGGIRKTVDHEHGNVCYQSGAGLSCVPIGLLK